MAKLIIHTLEEVKEICIGAPETAERERYEKELEEAIAEGREILRKEALKPLEDRYERWKASNDKKRGEHRFINESLEPWFKKGKEERYIEDVIKHALELSKKEGTLPFVEGAKFLYELIIFDNVPEAKKWLQMYNNNFIFTQ